LLIKSKLVIMKIGIIIINDSKTNNIVTTNVANCSISENRDNLSNFLNNECVNIYVTWY